MDQDHGRASPIVMAGGSRVDMAEKHPQLPGYSRIVAQGFIVTIFGWHFLEPQL
jgi:hypothetical protein